MTISWRAQLITLLEQTMVCNGWAKPCDESPVFVGFNAALQKSRIPTMSSLCAMN